ncbi:hypothetical protein MPNT_160035 [Candidatus Methylacidithermus pantelleriae]|uniref:Uncharacterized protein n=1 Tax=Candidatus Methylacidithermus pantelleriae TaxID=2744239 RepID=A0A8J2BJX9_9BACT|nr:hypothetical protein MPNT_160035 [Candidatus Methylacidithermus pantelleriae]
MDLRGAVAEGVGTVGRIGEGATGDFMRGVYYGGKSVGIV